LASEDTGDELAAAAPRRFLERIGSRVSPDQAGIVLVALKEAGASKVVGIAVARAP
jgi:hypothetical protein